MSDHDANGVVLESHQVLLRPLVTEKTTHAAERFNVYCFEVVPTATKSQIKTAVEEMFNVRVTGVRTQTRQGKSRRYRMQVGRTKDWKKAVVQLHDEDRINLY